MQSRVTFVVFMEKVRAGDQAAARELVGRFEGLIRREVRLRLGDHRLLRIFDSTDIMQSVLASFFTRAGTGQFELDTPEQLAGLLVRMTRTKLAFHVRYQRARRRDGRLNLGIPVDELAIAGAVPGPSEQATNDDLIDAVRARLDAEERQLADLRFAGWEWSEIAGRLGGTAQARRMQLARAVHRVGRLLNLKEGDCA
jgi:RNA polymerase sigma-70 factor (ECF subfamily)